MMTDDGARRPIVYHTNCVPVSRVGFELKFRVRVTQGHWDTVYQADCVPAPGLGLELGLHDETGHNGPGTHRDDPW